MDDAIQYARSAGASARAASSLLRWVPPALALIVVLGWLWVVLGVIPETNIVWIDWKTYALASERMLQGESMFLPEQLAGPYYLPDGTVEGYAYPPASAVLFLPFAFGDIGLLAWVVANVALLLSGIAAIVQREFGSLRPIPLALSLLGLLFLVPLAGGTIWAPFPHGVLTGNVNVILAGFLAWCWATGERRSWIAYAAGIGAIVKVFPGALVLWAARRHGWRPVVISGGVAGVVAVATFPLVGLDEWRNFFLALSNALPSCGDYPSLTCMAEPLVGQGAAKLIAMIAGAVLLALAVLLRHEYLAFVLLTMGMLAPLVNGHQSYLLFFYVLLVIGACRFAAARGRRPSALASTA
jgi:hypothetical protein